MARTALTRSSIVSDFKGADGHTKDLYAPAEGGKEML